MADIIFYTRRACGLCDRLKALLQESLEEESSIRLVEIDIDRDSELVDLYRHRVPVVTWQGRIVLEGRPGADEVDEVVAMIERQAFPA